MPDHSDRFTAIIARVLRSEGGYVNDPSPHGGATNHGITIGLAKAIGVDINGDHVTDALDIKALAEADATKIYHTCFWLPIQGDELPPGLDYALLDFCVNSGVPKAVMVLQGLLGVAADGHLGPITLAAIGKADPAAVVRRLCAARRAYLATLSNYPANKKGWLARIDNVETAALAMVGTRPAAPQSSLPHVAPYGGGLVVAIGALLGGDHGTAIWVIGAMAVLGLVVAAVLYLKPRTLK